MEEQAAIPWPRAGIDKH